MDVDRARRRYPIICFHCKKPGHVIKDCRERMKVREAHIEEVIEEGQGKE